MEAVCHSCWETGYRWESIIKCEWYGPKEWPDRRTHKLIIGSISYSNGSNMVPYWDLRILNAGEICDIGIETTCDSLEVSRMAPGRNAYQTLNWRVTPLKHSFLLAMFFLERIWQNCSEVKDFIQNMLWTLGNDRLACWYWGENKILELNKWSHWLWSHIRHGSEKFKRHIVWQGLSSINFFWHH
jgi:hypothetical protein